MAGAPYPQHSSLVRVALAHHVCLVLSQHPQRINNPVSIHREWRACGTGGVLIRRNSHDDLGFSCNAPDGGFTLRSD